MLIPSWNAERFIEECIGSVQGQTHRDLRILVSDDCSDDRTVDLCRAMARTDDRLVVDPAPERLGWIGNTNRLLELVDAPYFMVMPHDDVLDRTYVEKLLRLLEGSARAVCAVPDIQMFGDHSTRIGHPGWATGRRHHRLQRFIGGGPNGAAMRGVTRSSAVESGLRLRPTRASDLHADTTYVVELLALGRVVRLPELLYRKRILPTSVMASQWWAQERSVVVEEWAEHTIQLTSVCADLGLSRRGLVAVLGACLDRLVRALEFGAKDREHSHSLQHLDRVVAHVAELPGRRVSSDWAESRGVLARGELALGRSDAPSALQRAHAAQLLDPSSLLPEVLAARAHLALGDRPAAVRVARRHARHRQWDIESHRQIVLILRGAGEHSDLGLAERLARRLCRLEPLRARHWVLLSKIVADRGDLLGAIEHARMAVSCDPSTGQHLDSLLSATRGRE